MKKPTLLYASPFPPMQSGISDYSVVLVKVLAEKFDITLYTDDYSITEKTLQGFPVKKHGVDEIDFGAFDYLLYNMGNNALFHVYIYEAILKHPGVVILHDLVLNHFVREYYGIMNRMLYSSLYSKFGIDVFTAIKRVVKEGESLGDINIAARFPLNEEVLKSGSRIIVHSDYSRERILKTGLISPEDIQKINLIEQIEDEFNLVPKKLLTDKFNIPEDALLICSFVYIQDTKHNLEICRAVKRIQESSDKKICYVMVGKGDYADDELEEQKIIKTGYTDLDEFNSFTEYADIVVNLRYPTLGETSAAMLRNLQMGKVIITNNGGWFTEIPDDCVIKIDPKHAERDLETALRELIEHPEAAAEMGRRAKEYVGAEHGKQMIAEKMYRFITGA